MQSLEVLLLLLFAVGALESADRKTAYQKHVANLKRFPCGIPQPRVFDAEKLIPKDDYTGGTISPVITVLHRCYNTGCCERDVERCMPFETEEVTVTFSIRHKSLKFVDVTLTNHTQCVCSDSYNEIDDNIIKRR